jgi:putative ABC transport system substrate-binding protein
MRRREFIALVGGAATWPLAAQAQQPAMPRIGFLSTASAESIAPFVEGFRRGLGAVGFTEGSNIVVEYRWADNRHDRLPALAADLVAQRLAVIVTGGATAAALAAKDATSTIPIVFAIGADPVKVGLVDSMSRPNGNVTGASFLANDLVAKQLQLLQALVPPASVIGVLANPNNPNARFDTAEAQAAASRLQLRVHVVNVATERDVDTAFDDLARARSAAFLVLADTLFIDLRKRLAEIAAARSCLRSTATACTWRTAG